MPYLDYFNAPSSNATQEEKIAIIKENELRARELRNKIRVLTSGRERIDAVIPTTPSLEKNNVSGVSKESKEEKPNEVLSKLLKELNELNITGLDIEETNNLISSIINKYSVSEIAINKLKLLLYQDYLLYSKMLISASNASEYRELKQEIEEILIKINCLDSLEQESELTSTITQNNNLYFLKTKGGNVIFLDSLRKIPKEFYPFIRNLLIGLHDGNLKGLKYLHLQKYFELKDLYVRILFDRLSNGDYIILDAFVKKEDTSAHYRSRLVTRNREYNAVKESYFANLNNEAFKEEHAGYLAEALTMLNAKEAKEELNNGRSI